MNVYRNGPASLVGETGGYRQELNFDLQTVVRTFSKLLDAEGQWNGDGSAYYLETRDSEADTSWTTTWVFTKAGTRKTSVLVSDSVALSEGKAAQYDYADDVSITGQLQSDLIYYVDSVIARATEMLDSNARSGLS